MRPAIHNVREMAAFERDNDGEIYAVTSKDGEDCRYYTVGELETVKSDAMTLRLMGDDSVRVHHRTERGPEAVDPRDRVTPVWVIINPWNREGGT
jgi:hypothetical protein